MIKKMKEKKLGFIPYYNNSREGGKTGRIDL